MDRELFQEPRRSFLFHDGAVWVKTKYPEFDFAMGAFDGAEACELVCLLLLNEIVEADIGLKKENFGLNSYIRRQYIHSPGVSAM